MDRGRFRGPRGGRGGARGGGSSHQNSSSGNQQQGSERPKKENILDLQRFLNKEIKVKFNGGREGMYAAYD
jgi:U6 snRNA-associated Sm-like protein LSm7